MYKTAKRVLAAAVAAVLLFSGNVIARAQTQDSNPSQAVTEGQAQDILAQRRDMAEQHMRSICSMLWRCEEDIYYSTDSNVLPEDTTNRVIHLQPGRIYQGMPYSYGGGAKETFMELTTGPDEQGIYSVADLNWQMVAGSYKYGRFGNDCSGSVCQSWSQFGTSVNFAVTSGMTTKNGYLRVGEYTSSDTTHSKTDEVCIANGEQTMYAAYAQAQKADAVVHHLTSAETGSSWGHVMMTVSVDVVYNEDGTINGDESVMTILEQTTAHVRKEIKEYNQDLGEDVYWICGVDIEYTFAQLFKEGYLPITCKELVDPATVAAPKVTDSLSASEYGYDTLLSGSISTNHWTIDSVLMTITDKEGNIVQQGRATCPRTNRYKFSMSLFETELPTMILGCIAPDALTAGSYHCKVVLRLSTNEEFTVRDYDFTVTNTPNDIHKTTLDFSNSTVHDCPACGTKNVQWNALTSANVGTGNGAAPGHYYLSESMNSNTTYIPFSGGTFCLYLNGCDIKSSERVFYIAEETTLNVLGKGTLTGGATASSDRAATIDNYGGTVNLYGGTYKHYKVSGKAAKSIIGIRNGGVVNMYDGAEVVGTNGVTRSSVLVYDGRMNMYGGKITGGYSTNGGNVLVGYDGTEYNLCYFSMFGGEISGGNGTGMGGNIYGVYDSIIYIHGGKITGGTAAKGGSVAINKGAHLYMDGGLVTGGTATEQGNALYATNVENRATGTILADSSIVLDGNIQLDGTVYTENKVAIRHYSGVALIKNKAFIGRYPTVEDTKDKTYNYLRLHENIDLPAGDWKVDLNGNTAYFNEGTLQITADGGATFLPVNLGINKVYLRTSAAGIYFTGAWDMDGLDVASYGVATSVEDMPTSDFFTDADTLYTVFNSENSGSTGALIRNIFSKDAEDNAVRGKTNIHSAAYMTFSDGSAVIGGETASCSLYQIITFLEGTFDPKWETQRTEFYTAWADVFALWGMGI